MICFKGRVDQFYKLFEQQEAQLRAAMDQGAMDEATQQMQVMLRPVFGDQMFQLYKKGEKNYILECNTMLDSGKKILCFYFCGRLPEKFQKLWSFYYYHPAFCGDLAVGEDVFHAEDFHMIPSIQDKAHRVDLAIVLTDKFGGIPDEERYAITYMMLTDYLGEIAAEAYIGRISFRKMGESFSRKENSTLTMRELRDFLDQTIQSKGWIRVCEIRLIADSFQLKNKEKGCRKDMKNGVSYSLDLLNEEEKSPDDREKTQYLKKCGVRYASLLFPRGGRPEEVCKKEKENWEKKLSCIFSREHSGTIITSAFGNTNFYLDFFAYDEETFQRICREAEKEIPPLTVLDLVSR